MELQLWYPWDSQKTVFFYGATTRIERLKDNQVRIIAREWTSLLDEKFPYAKRNITPQNILIDLSQKLKIGILTPKNETWLTEILPDFHHQGSARGLITSLMNAVAVENPFWVQAPSGHLFLGSHPKSGLAKVRLSLSEEWLEPQGSAWRIPSLPNLRPGMFLNDQLLSGVRFEGVYSFLEFQT